MSESQPARVETYADARARRESARADLAQQAVRATRNEDTAAAFTGTGEPYTKNQPAIADPCPSCGSRRLFIGSGGWLTCGNLGCAKPSLEDAIAARVELMREVAALAERRRILEELDGRIAECDRSREHHLEASAEAFSRLVLLTNLRGELATALPATAEAGQ